MLLTFTLALVIGAMLFLTTQSHAANTLEIIPEEQTDSLKTPKKGDPNYDDRTFTKVEQPAEFPGELDGWRRYLERNLKYPKKAVKKNTQGTVKVQVVVESDGTVSEVAALNNPGDGLAEEAVRVIKKGPKWKPAEQNGRKVRHRFVQSITFLLGEARLEAPKY